MNSESYGLPLELLHQILLTVVTDSVHAVGTSRGTPWDIRVFTTLAKVSPLFDDIIYELVGKVFGLIDDDGNHNIIIEAEKLMNQFRQLGEPDEWPRIANVYPKQYPSYIFNAYALLSCAICLRQAATDSSVFAFLATQDGARTALKQAAIVRSRIATPEIASALNMRITQELELLTGGITLVRCCMQMNTLVDRLSAFATSAETVTKEEEVIHTQLSQLLLTFENAAAKYDHELTFVEPPQPRAAQLPDVTPTIRRMFCTFNSRKLALLEARIQSLVSHWTNDCSFLSKDKADIRSLLYIPSNT